MLLAYTGRIYGATDALKHTLERVNEASNWLSQRVGRLRQRDAAVDSAVASAAATRAYARTALYDTRPHHSASSEPGMVKLHASWR